MKRDLAYPIHMADDYGYREHRRTHGWLRDFFIAGWLAFWVVAGLLLLFAIGSAN